MPLVKTVLLNDQRALVCPLPSELNDTFSDANNDTVGRIVQYIMKNEGKGS